MLANARKITYICIAMENTTLPLQVVPAPASVQSGAEIEVRLKYACDGFYRIIKKSGMSDEDFDLVLSSFREVYETFSGEYLVELSERNIQDGVMILGQHDVEYYSLKEVFDIEMPDVHVYVKRSKHFNEILPVRDFRPGLDFVTNLFAYIPSDAYVKLYSDETADTKIYETDDLFYIGIIFGNRRKFGDDPLKFLSYVKEGLEEVNCWANGLVYDVWTYGDSFVASSEYLNNIKSKYMVIYIDTSY